MRFLTATSIGASWMWSQSRIFVLELMHGGTGSENILIQERSIGLLSQITMTCPQADPEADALAERIHAACANMQSLQSLSRVPDGLDVRWCIYASLYGCEVDSPHS